MPVLVHAPFPPGSYLLRAERRFRYRGADGRPDLAALQLAAKVLPSARELTVQQRERLGRVLARVEKSVAAFGDAAAAGLLDERFGFPIFLEVPFGGIRQGVSADGQPWQKPLLGAAYGFLPDTVARDDEELDVIVGPDATAPSTFVLAQNNPEGGLDEYKLGVGFSTLDDFERCYLENWPPQLYGGITVMPTEVLRGLLGFELDEEGVVSKSLRVLAGDGGMYAIAKSGAIFGRVVRIEKDAWTAAYIDDLPDSAFLYVEPGGGKDEESKTTPRTLRHLPVMDKAGNPDATHLRNALARLPQAKIPDSAKEEARKKAQSMLEELNSQAGKSGDTTEQRRTNGASGTPAVDPVASGATEPTFKASVRLMPIEKALDASTPVERRIVYGVVLEPEPFDGRGDGHDETYSADVIEKAAHAWLASFRNFDDRHGRFFGAAEVQPVECFIAPCDYTWCGSEIKKGSWVLAARVLSDEVWGRVLRNELNAWSIEGYAERVPNA